MQLWMILSQTTSPAFTNQSCFKTCLSSQRHINNKMLSVLLSRNLEAKCVLIKMSWLKVIILHIPLMLFGILVLILALLYVDIRVIATRTLQLGMHKCLSSMTFDIKEPQTLPLEHVWLQLCCLHRIPKPIYLGAG